MASWSNDDQVRAPSWRPRCKSARTASPIRSVSTSITPLQSSMTPNAWLVHHALRANPSDRHQREPFSSGGLVEPIVEAHEFERGRAPFGSEEGGGELGGVSRAKLVHAKEPLGRLAHLVTGLD